MMFRPSSIILLVAAVVGTANADCPLDSQTTGTSCSKKLQMCTYNTDPQGNVCACGRWQCDCFEGAYICRCKGDGCKEADESDVEALDVGSGGFCTTSSLAMTASGIVAAAALL